MDVLEYPLPAADNGDEPAGIVAAALSKPVPIEFQALVVNVIGPHPAEWRANEYRKAYILKADATGSDRSDWSEPRQKPYAATSAHSLAEAYLTGEPLTDLRDLLESLELAPTRAVVLGRLRDDKRADRDGTNYLVKRRTLDFYDDQLTRLLPVDVDALDCDDPLEAGDAIDDFISKHMPELEGCAYVWNHTGSSGIKGVRVRLWFLLAEPRHLAAMRDYAQRVNERAGRSVKVIDDTIYQPARLIFTAEPELQASDGIRIPRRAPAGVWHVDGDMVPGDAFADVKPGAEAAGGTQVHMPQGRMPKALEGELLASLAPGNYAMPIHRWISSQACRAPDDARGVAAFHAACATLRHRVVETSEPGECERRLREHCDVRKLRRQWDKAREWHRDRILQDVASSPVAGSVLPSLANLRVNTAGAGTLADLTHGEREALLDEYEPVPATPLSIDDARRQLAADFARIADSVLCKGQKGHWLLTHPPGSGKSTALGYMTKPGFLWSNLVRIYAPTHRLAEELVTKLRGAALQQPGLLPIHGDVAARIRHHKGRSQLGMCVDVESKPRAERAERLGVSVKKTVCSRCKSRDVCPWLRQADDEECGIVVETHAAALVDKSKRRADFVIVDESIVTSMIDSGIVDIDALSVTASIRLVTGNGSVGRVMGEPTLALTGYRSALVMALRAVVPTEAGKTVSIATAALTDFARPVNLKARDGFRLVERTGVAAEEAVELETWLQASLATQIAHREDTGKSAADLWAQHDASRAAAALYSAIGASLKAGRQYVFGVAALSERRRQRVKYAVRAADVAHIFGEASVTLDGTANADVWRNAVSPAGARFDGEVIGANVAVPAGVRVFQYVDKSGSRSSLLPDLRETESEKERKATRDGLVGARSWARSALGPDQYDIDVAIAQCAVVADDTRRETRKVRGDSNLSLIARAAAFHAAEARDRAAVVDGKPVSVLLVAQKAVADAIRPMVPDGVAIEHFGVLRGLNKYENVPVAIVVGRSRPSNVDLELIAEALHSHNPQVQAIARYDVAPKEGRPWLERHPNTLVDALQSQITTAGVQQAIARVRMFNRSLDNPVDVHVFGVCDPGLPTELVSRRAWSDAERSHVEIAAARGCVFDDMRLNHRAHPGLFSKGAKDGRGRIDREGKRRFGELVANLVRHVQMQDEFGLYPNREVRDRNLDSLLALETEFVVQQQRSAGDALDYSADGSEQHPGRRHRLVKVRVAGAGYACLAIVDARWGEADVAQLVGAPVDAWKELTAAELLALAAKMLFCKADVR